MDVRPDISVATPFVWWCLSSLALAPVSTLPSSNRTCAFGASGSRTSAHASFACNAVCSFRTLGGVSRLPNLPSFTTFHIDLNEGSFPPPALPGFPGTMSPSDSPPRPIQPSQASGWSLACDHAMGSPVLPRFSLCTCRRPYPGGTAGCLSLSSPAMPAFPV